MGGKNMTQVMNWLDGADVSLKGWDSRKRAVVPGCAKERKLDAYDLALLLTIAHRQHDEEKNSVWNGQNCICIGNEANMAEFARMGRSKMEESRAFMQAMNLISYHDHESDCIDFKNPNKRTSYDYVYRLNKHILSGLKLPRKQGELATQAEGACHASIKNTLEDTKKNTKQDVGVVDKDENTERAKYYRQYIITYCHLKETQPVGLAGVKTATANKDYKAVLETIQSFAKSPLLKRPGQFGKWIGSLINELKALPTTTVTKTAAEIEQEFGRPVYTEEPSAQAEGGDISVYRGGWDNLFIQQHLADVTGTDDIKPIETAFENAFGRMEGNALRYAIESFLKGLPPPAEDVSARVQTILGALSEIASRENQ